MTDRQRAKKARAQAKDGVEYNDEDCTEKNKRAPERLTINPRVPQLKALEGIQRMNHVGQKKHFKLKMRVLRFLSRRHSSFVSFLLCLP